MTAGQQAMALNQQGLSHDAVKSLANGLPEQKSVQWAAASADKVSSPANKADTDAISAAKAWSKNPTAENKNAAAAAAAATDHKTPGAWAAQAAAWSGTGNSPHAVSGAVMLASAQSAPKAAAPEVATAAQKPKSSLFQLFKKPAVETPQAPQTPTTGADGLTLTPAQRSEMAKNTEPFIKMGCDIEAGKLV
jgi:hypothetical protein